MIPTPLFISGKRRSRLMIVPLNPGDKSRTGRKSSSGAGVRTGGTGVALTEPVGDRAIDPRLVLRSSAREEHLHLLPLQRPMDTLPGDMVPIGAGLPVHQNRRAVVDTDTENDAPRHL